MQSSLLLVSVWCFTCLREVNKEVTAVGDHVLMAHQRAGGREMPISTLLRNLKCFPLTVTPSFTHANECFCHLFKLKAVAVGSNYFMMGLFICAKADFPGQYSVLNTVCVPASVGIVCLEQVLYYVIPFFSITKRSDEKARTWPCAVFCSTWEKPICLMAESSLWTINRLHTAGAVSPLLTHF